MSNKTKAQRLASKPKTKRTASEAPLFLADVEGVERDFAYADAEVAKMIDDGSSPS